MAANLRKTNKCYRCGAEIEPGSRYCMECGAPLKKPHGNGMIAGVAAALVIVAVFGGNAFKKMQKKQIQTRMSRQKVWFPMWILKTR